jgi:hypothetical protein
MKTEQKWIELTAAIFLFIFFMETKRNTKNPKKIIKTNTVENRYGTNMVRAWKESR